MVTQLAGHSLHMKGREGVQTENVLSILENSLGNIGLFFLGIFSGLFLSFQERKISTYTSR